ncbi:hypothetical protein FA13DRAFT_1785702 [Coprinellus micaceus]|uniref:Uncharacterized protein n=1 Tax=Coprinellus micaceus TaxID=71717 RepID=A0A4Y7TVA3_COPMI|nr:hypothetical protein FA13DRAFT_1785702 [Coprinellus micaceus]
MRTETNTTDSLMRDIEKLKQQRDDLRKLVEFHEAEATRLRKEIQCLKDDAADAEARGVSLQRAHSKAGGKQKELRGLATSFPGVTGQVQFMRPKASTTKIHVQECEDSDGEELVPALKVPITVQHWNERAQSIIIPSPKRAASDSDKGGSGKAKKARIV